MEREQKNHMEEDKKWDDKKIDAASPEERLAYFQEEYQRERMKSAKLSSRLADANRKADDLQANLDRIKNSGIWKASEPARNVYHLMQRTKDRVGNYGSPKGIARKVKSKMIEKKARLQHGTASFPNEAQRQIQQNTKFSKNIKFSILVPLYNTPDVFLKEMIESVLNQTYENWELCLADGSDQQHEKVQKMCMEYAKNENRIKYKKLLKNGGISENTNACFEMATGEFIGLFDHDDVLHPSALFEYMKVICEQNADYIYCDETTFKGNGTIDDMLTIHFKPDYAIDNLRANNYICHFSVFNRHLLDNMQLFRTEFDGSQDHDMILRLTSRANNVVHVPKLLYYWRSHKGSVAADINAKSYAIEAARGAVADHLQQNGFQNFEISSTKAFETIFRIKYEIIGNPKISIVIPNKDHIDDLQRCIDSILKQSTYDNYEIIIVENNSIKPETEEYYKKLETADNVQIVRYQGEFHYSKICNLGVNYATGEYVLLLNNDTQIISIDWMEELLMYAQRSDVGAVGSKLYYEDKTIQHAGIVIGLGAHRTAGHTHYRVAQTNLGYMGRLCYAQDVTAVTGACLMVKKSLYDELGGLSDEFAIALNDVDFCLRLRQKGYLNIWNPYCELFHYESISRGMDDQGDKAARYNLEAEHFRGIWKEELEKGDPYYNPNFSLDRSDYSLKI